jgi:integrase/recombinase XerC
MTQSLIPYNPTIEAMIDGWLAEKHRSKSGSARTERAYRETMQSFRVALASACLDVNSQPGAIISIAQSWAGERAASAKREGVIAPATYNQRLAIVSSFYAYLNDQAQAQNETYPNPIEAIKKPKVQAYAEASPLDADDVFERLLAIDRSTVIGKRDYALLVIGLQTGRRASELVGLHMKHVKMTGKKITLHFDHCKGGKKMRDTLDPDTAAVFLDYLYAVYGADLLHVDNDAPVWVSFSRQNKGQPISIHTLIDICEKHLEVSKVHVLRHTFAAEMMEAKAPITELQYRLGHENIATTSIYTKRLRSADNPYATRLSARFGIGKSK